jgi:Na+-translocating ferredoxin:NAD+ oxidoreductase RnfA subunit
MWSRWFAGLVLWLVTFIILSTLGLEWWQSIAAVIVIGVASEIDRAVFR